MDTLSFDFYSNHSNIDSLQRKLQAAKNVFLDGLCASSSACFFSQFISKFPKTNLFLFPDHEAAAYFYNDLCNILGENNIFFFPSSYKRLAPQLQAHEGNIILRTRVIEALLDGKKTTIITYADALAEKVTSRENFNKNVLPISVGENLSISFVKDVLREYNFTQQDFVYEPGQFSIRGSIVDIFSFANPHPYRVDFFGDEVESIRTFDVETQRSLEKTQAIHIIPDMTFATKNETRSSLLNLIPASDLRLFIKDTELVINAIERIEDNPPREFHSQGDAIDINAAEIFTSSTDFLKVIAGFPRVEFGASLNAKHENTLSFNTAHQPSFNKNFELLAQDIASHIERGYQVFILSDNPKQFSRLKSIFAAIKQNASADFHELQTVLHEGFIDHNLQKCFYTDHQIFERYHKYKSLYAMPSVKNSLTIKELQNLHPGDFVVHADHGIGVFAGLEKITVNGKTQESIRLVYRDNDILNISIHKLHKISKYRAKDGTPPKIHKLGTPAWQNLKQTTKKKVKDIARELIRLYAERRINKGFAFSHDSFLQEELEASFLYEDTPDQLKATQAVKASMERDTPMDHLICGDVGFGKTEIAVRAAFKATLDNKQVAVLVPTTILALQHEQTFKERLAKFPVRIESLSRLKTFKQQKALIKEVNDGKVDIIIGTHRLLGKDILFKDLGLIIIDEEQKFGVAAKEKLRRLRSAVDTLTLTATPIPRTLQFSLMGVREMSVISTPPPNRHPIQTELITFDKDTIKEAIEYEVARGGQVFFIHNRVQSLPEIETMIRSICPEVSTISAHGQMDGEALEKIMLDFVSGDYNVLVATSIIEAGLDIPNANTIIIDNAHNFGLSDLHQMRGRVGRSNKRAFCYLLTPSLTGISADARRRLQAIEEFAELGSGFNIAMQDLDIRGAGNLMGAEQSGFIADIGFETYNRILNEAMEELKNEPDFKPLFENQQLKSTIDCQLDTDLQLLFPDNYIENTSERIRLYRLLDNIDDDKELDAFTKDLEDRFGKPPREVIELLMVVRLRARCAKLGFDKISIKANKLALFFVADTKNPYYDSQTFKDVLAYISGNPKLFQLKDIKQRLVLNISNISSIEQSLAIVERLFQTVFPS